MNRVALTFAFFILLAATTTAQQRGLGLQTNRAEKRVALVIGNGNYGVEELNLTHPVNDALDVAQALRELGFEVIPRNDLTQREMIRSIREFKEKIRGGVGLFYYAGHGMQVRGENYLIPVGANIESEADVSAESVSLDFLLDQMGEAMSHVNIIVLDACRDNPFTRSFRSSSARGLAPVFAPSGTLIAYSTAPGKVAYDGEKAKRNSRYAEELIKNIKKPGISIEEMFKLVRAGLLNSVGPKQTSWEHSSLIDPFYFNPSGTNASAQKANPAIDEPKSNTNFGAPNMTQSTPSISVSIQSVKGFIWVEQNVRGEGDQPIFYRFKEGGKVLARFGINGAWSEIDNERWYQADDTIYYYTYSPYRDAPKNDIFRECEGKVKGSRIEGQCILKKDIEKKSQYDWVLIRVIE